MGYLFVYDHLMDLNEFKQCFPNVEFRFIGIGRVDHFKISWIAKGIPFCCRVRPTLISSPNSATYGVIIKLNNHEKKSITEYVKYLSNNLLIQVNAVVIKPNNFEEVVKNANKNFLLLNSGINRSDDQTLFNFKVMTFCAEYSNMIFDSKFADFLLSKGVDFSGSKYLIEVNKSYKKISPTFPSESYVNLLTKIAKYYHLPDFYIEENLNLPFRQKLSSFEALARKAAIKYMYIITKLHLQSFGFGVIDLFWELDPQDPLVFVDFGQTNKIIIFIITLMSFILSIFCFVMFC